MSNRRQAAFTLIELLVLIAIVAILFAMLSPLLQRMIGTARTTQCANNLHQMHTALSAYSDDNHNNLPGHPYFDSSYRTFDNFLYYCYGATYAGQPVAEARNNPPIATGLFALQMTQYTTADTYNCPSYKGYPKKLPYTGAETSLTPNENNMYNASYGFRYNSLMTVLYTGERTDSGSAIFPSNKTYTTAGWFQYAAPHIRRTFISPKRSNWVLFSDHWEGNDSAPHAGYANVVCVNGSVRQMPYPTNPSGTGWANITTGNWYVSAFANYDKWIQ